MSSCKDCLHYEVCREVWVEICDVLECEFFQSKTEYVKRERGEWVIKTDEYDREYVVCSVCKEEFYPIDADTVDTTPNFCPDCGADMRGENNA